MNNTELEQKIKEIINTTNFFDMIEKAIAFEPEYKNSDFFKHTKIKLMEILKSVKEFYTFNINETIASLQKGIDGLNLDHFSDLLNNVENVFKTENEQTLENFKTLKGLVEEMSWGNEIPDDDEDEHIN